MQVLAKIWVVRPQYLNYLFNDLLFALFLVLSESLVAADQEIDDGECFWVRFLQMQMAYLVLLQSEVSFVHDLEILLE